MILSLSRRLCFVHIPKTGGTSVTLALEAGAPEDDVIFGDTPGARARRKRQKGLAARGRLWKHATLADIDGLVTPRELAGLFCFTLVRNPWDRAVSYYHWLQAQTFDHPAVHLAGALAFAEFLRHPHTVASLSAWPARRYMTDALGRERCDLFARLEHLETDLAPLTAHLGAEIRIPHVNRSERGRYSAYYDGDLATHLGTVCAEDVRRFGYRFD